jgi:CheY-like chemotaxis protein
MTVESEPGRGSIFRVHLPVVEADQAGSDPIEPEHSGRPARVLLLMKDSQLRMLARKTLENMGFLVQACSNPVETVRTIESEAAYFDLAIVPAGMPINDLREELAHRVRTRLPSVPIIVTRSPDGNAATLPPGECRVLDVPFSIADFIALVKASLPHGAVPRLRP